MDGDKIHYEDGRQLLILVIYEYKTVSDQNNAD